jgi:hypothetical protein
VFSLGRNKSTSTSTEASDSYGYSNSGSSNLSSSSGSSSSASSGRSFTDVAFADIFSSLYGNAGGAAARAAEMAPGFSEQVGQLFSGGLSFLEDLGGGSDYLEGRVAGDDGVLQEQIGALGDDLGSFFREELNPAITARAVGGGTLGGGRQGVAQGRAMAAVGEEFQRGATALRTADRTSRDAIASTLLQQRGSNAAAGLNALPGLASVAQAGFGAELAPWEALSSILGGPVTLAGSEQSSYASSEEIARAIASSFGASEDFATSRSSSTGKSSGWNIGGGKSS